MLCLYRDPKALNMDVEKKKFQQPREKNWGHMANTKQLSKIDASPCDLLLSIHVQNIKCSFREHY